MKFCRIKIMLPVRNVVSIIPSYSGIDGWSEFCTNYAINWTCANVWQYRCIVPKDDKDNSFWMWNLEHAWVDDAQLTGDRERKRKIQNIRTNCSYKLLCRSILRIGSKMIKQFFATIPRQNFHASCLHQTRDDIMLITSNQIVIIHNSL